MNSPAYRLSLVFVSGAAGGLFNGIVVWLFGYLGITAFFGVAIAPVFTPAYIYQRVVWGGIWGAALFVPLLPGKPVIRGIIISLLPTLVQLFIVFPLKAKKGIMGLDLGLLTPLFVIIFNIVWGVVAVLWHKRITE